MSRVLRLRMAQFIALLFFATAATGQVLHVDQSATGSGDGSTWIDALTSLQDALQQAELGLADEIWIAEGTYSPGTTRESTFLIADGVSVVGGFRGVEASVDDRVVNYHAASPTILDGDWDDNSDFGFGDETSSYKVVTITGNSLLDGVIVQGGNDTRPKGFLDAFGVGGGITVSGSSSSLIEPTIRNTVIRGNFSSSIGAGISAVNAGLIMENVLITGNGGAETQSATVAAASGVTNLGAAQIVHPITMTNVTIAGNGGQSFFDSEAGSAEVLLVAQNSIIYGNGTGLSTGSTLFQDTKATLENTVFESVEKQCPKAGVTCTNVSGADPELRTTDGFLSLQASSIAALDLGDNSAVPAVLATDGANRERIQNGTVDLGWVEGTTAVESTGGSDDPDISVGSASIDFGSVAVGSSGSQTLLISNTGMAALAVSDVTISGTDAGQFSITDGDAPFILGPGENATIGLAFDPASAGEKSAALTIASDDPDEGSVEVALSGTGTTETAPDIAVNTASLDFGSVSTGTSKELTLTVSNQGTASLDASSVSITGTNASLFSVVSGNAPFTVAAGGSRNLTVKFSPATPGSKGATLSIASNDPDESTLEVLLVGDGSGTNNPEISINPTGLSYGIVSVGTSRLLELTVNNQGSSLLTVTSITITGQEASNFSISSGNAPFSVSSGGSRVVGVQFTPATPGAKNATIVINSNDDDEGTINVSLSGEGTDVGQPEITVSPTLLDFEIVDVGSSRSLLVTITNAGDAALNVDDIRFTGPDARMFSFSGTREFSLGPGAGRFISVRFTPTSTGLKTATLAIINNDSDENPVNVQLRGGEGQTVGPDIVASPIPLAFGPVQVGQTSRQTLVLSNAGTQSLSVSSIELSGLNAAAFSIISGQAPLTIASGGSADVVVEYTAASGSAQATMTVKSNDPDEGTVTVPVSGSGVFSGNQPDISVSTTELNFGVVQVEQSATRTLVVNNDGTSELSVTDLQIVGSLIFDYEIVGGDAPFSVAPGASSDITVRFNPSEPRESVATMRVLSNDPDEAQIVVDLVGRGVSTAVQDIAVEPASLGFGVVQVDFDANRTLNVRNLGATLLDVSDITVTGIDASQFSIAGTGAPFGVDGGAERALIVRFAPTSVGTKSAMLNLFSDDPDENPLSVPLSGEGTLEDVSGSTRIQFVHNIADPLAEKMDVYRDGSLWLDNVAFRTATPLAAATPGPAVLALAPSNSSDVLDAWSIFSIEVPEGEALTIVASGVLEPRAFAPNPDGRATNIGLQLQTRSGLFSKRVAPINLFAVHGATDVATVDLVARPKATIADGLTYGETSTPQTLEEGRYQIDVTLSFDQNLVLASYQLDLSDREAANIVLVLSGFADPSENLDGAPLGLMLVFPDGSIEMAPPTGTARIQFIQNIPDPNVARVDLWANSVRVVNDQLYRTATAYTDVTAGFVDFGVAPSSSSSPEEAWATVSSFLEDGEAYIIVVDGVLDPRTFSRNPDGRNTAVNIRLRSGARQEALSPNFVDFIVSHGVLDVGTVDFVVPGFGTFVDGAGYGDVTDYVSLIPGTLGVMVTNSSDQSQVVTTYRLDFSRKEGLSAVLLLSGFREPQFNLNGDPMGLVSVFADGAVRQMAVGTSTESEEVPESTELLSNYPNPFNPTTTITYRLKEAAPVRMEVFNVLGERVAMLLDAVVPAGEHEVSFDASGLPSGMYFYTLSTKGMAQRRMMMLLK